MKILVIDNASIKYDDGHYYCNKSTGEFAFELMKENQKVEWLQIVQKGMPAVGSFDLTAHSIIVHSIKNRSKKYFTYIGGFFWGVKAVLKNDFTYMFYPNSFWFLLLICILFRKPYGFYIRGMVGVESRKSKFLYRHAKVILTVADYFTKSIKRIAPHTIVDTIRPMVDINEKDIYKRSFDSSPQKFNLLFLARIDRQKGLEELILAVKKLKEMDIPDFILNVYGNGQDSLWLEQKIKNLDMNSHVIMHGSVIGKDNILNVYRNADVYILPTYHEGFPRTLYEAMINGVPIITTLVGGISGLMKDGINCLAIEPRSVDSIVRCLSNLLLNYTDIAPNMVSEGYKTVLPIISHQRPSHSQLLQLYINN